MNDPTDSTSGAASVRTDTAEAVRRRVMAAKNIDLTTCRLDWWYVDVSDIYGENPVAAHVEKNIGRCAFLSDPDEGTAVYERYVRSLHPEIPDDEWGELVTAAAARGDAEFFNWLLDDDDAAPTSANDTVEQAPQDWPR